MSETISDIRFQELRDAGFVGSISDMERQRLLSVLTLSEPQNLSLMDLYRLADETPWPYSGFAPVIAGSNVVFADDFNRADGSLGANWVDLQGPAVIVGNQVTGSATTNYARTVEALPTPDGYAEVTIADTGGFVKGPMLRVPEIGINGYLWYSDLTGSASALAKVVAGTATILGSSYNHTLVAGDIYRIECEGTEIRGYINGTLRSSVSDSTFTTETLGGIRTHSTSTRIDNFEMGTL